MQVGNEREALADFEAAVEHNPGSWRSIHNRGVSYAAAGRIKEALADFNRTIELNKKYPNAFFNRAELNYSQGNFAAAASRLHGRPGTQAGRPLGAQQPRTRVLSHAAIR